MSLEGRPAYDREWTPFKATDGEIPAGGVFVDNGSVLDDAEEFHVIQARKVQVFGEQPLYVNSPSVVASDGDGDCVRPHGRPLWVAYLESDGTPALGEEWGPVPAAYTIRKGFPGFKILATGSGGIVWAVFDAPFMEYYCILMADLAVGSSAAATIYKFNGTTYVTSGVSATIYASPLATDTFLSGTMVWATWGTASRRLEFREAACSVATSSSGA
jgi:hypothetical protein